MSQLSKKLSLEAVKPRRIAVYAHLMLNDHYMVFEVEFETYDMHYHKLPEGEEREVTRSDYVRISEVMTISGKAVEEDTLTQNAVKSLDSSADAIRTDMLEQLAEIANRKKQLLAITYQGAPEAETMHRDPAFDPPPSYSGDSQGSVFDDDIPF